MSQKNGRTHKHKTKTGAKESISQRLARLANNIASKRGSDRDEDDITSIIYQCLEDGRDDILLESLEKTNTQESYETLEFFITDCSETRPVKLTTDETGEIMLFAIPVVMYRDTGKDFSDEIKDMSICKLFRKHGLVSQYPDVFLNNEFLHFFDVDLSPSKKYKMLVDAMKIQLGVENAPRSLRQHQDKEETNQQVPSLILRFLTGTVTSSLDEHVFFPDDEEAEEYGNSLEKWREEMKIELIKQTDLDMIAIGDPDLFSNSVLEGVNTYQEISLAIKTTAAVAKTAEARSLCNAIICFHKDENEGHAEIRISFIDNRNQLVDGFAWTLLPHNDPAELFEYCCTTITELGVGNYSIVDGFMPLTYCDCCGKPDFFTPNEESANMTHSTVLH